MGLQGGRGAGQGSGRCSSVQVATIERCATRQVSRQDLMRQLKWQAAGVGRVKCSPAQPLANLLVSRVATKGQFKLRNLNSRPASQSEIYSIVWEAEVTLEYNRRIFL